MPYATSHNLGGKIGCYIHIPLSKVCNKIIDKIDKNKSYKKSGHSNVKSDVKNKLHLNINTIKVNMRTS